MFWKARSSEKERFYLFAGMGGKAARRKHRFFLAWSLVAGLLVSLLLAGGLYLLNQW
jgi:hypothetical protein